MYRIFFFFLFFEYDYLYMLLKVDQNHKFLLVLNEYPSTHWPIFIHTRCIKFFTLISWIYPYCSQPILVFIAQFVDLIIVTI